MTSCFYCGEQVKGQLEKISLRICCYSCCTKSKSAYDEEVGGYYRISKVYAKSAYKISGRLNALCSIGHTTVDIYGHCNKKKLFIREEVAALSAMSAEMLKKYNKTDRRYRGRQKILNEEFGDWKHMDPTIRQYMIRNYLWKRPTDNAKLEEIRQRYKVASRAQEIIDKTERAHPKTVLQFCIENPSGGAKEFQELKDKTNFVLETFGWKIFYHLTEEEVSWLRSVDTPLQNLVEEFANRDFRKLIRWHLERLVDKQTAEEIMSCPACQCRIKSGGNEEIVAQKLLEFWREREDVKTRVETKVETRSSRHLHHAIEEYHYFEPNAFSFVIGPFFHFGLFWSMPSRLSSRYYKLEKEGNLQKFSPS